MDQQQGEQSNIDMGDIARGRRITAVTASEMSLTPRQGDRPRRPWGVTKAWRKLKFRLESVKYDD